MYKYYRQNGEVYTSTSATHLRADGRVEWICKHGVGHTVGHILRQEAAKDYNYVHGCCSGRCCS